MAKEDTIKYVVIGLVIVLGIFYFQQRNTTPTKPANVDWPTYYKYQAQVAGIDSAFFVHDNVIDTSLNIRRVAESIKSSSNSEKEAVRKTLEWTYSNIKYSADSIVLDGCIQETASSVYERGIGDCVSMTKLDIAILREMGIAARPAGGCISSSFSCSQIYSIAPGRVPKFTPVDINDPKKRGGLHEWVEIWLPGEGWIIGEATAGVIYEKNCVSYDYHDYNTDPRGMCVVDDYDYRRQCAWF